MRRISNPEMIEHKSFNIIEALLPDNLSLKSGEKAILKRVIHTTADLDYIKDLAIHPNAIQSAIRAIRSGRDIIVDVTMVKAGIDEKRLKTFGGNLVCFLNDKEVVEDASNSKITRAIVAMRKARKFTNGAIVAIGNSPTALFELCAQIKRGLTRPSLIVGVPVGFVGAVESKKELRTLDIPYITNRSRKGGSSVAAAIVNALLILAKVQKNGDTSQLGCVPIFIRKGVEEQNRIGGMENGKG